MRRTKIVCTIGPSCSAPAVMREVIMAGMNVARLNFSHGTPDSHRSMFQAIRNLGDGSDSALTDLQTLGKAVRLGIMDAPQLKNNPFAPGTVRTRVLDGACETVDEDGKIIDEQARLRHYL